MQKTVGLSRVGSGRASGRSQRGFPYHASSINYDGKIAGLYDLEETLGRGHFAVVKLARHVFTGEKVAVKVIDKTKLDEVSRAHLFQEVRCMKLVQHPNVVRLYEVIDTQTKLYLILELGDGGDLYDYIMRHENGLDQESARHYFRQVVHAISYCHQLHVVHRDLKPENVVFFEKLGMVKLTDFGFSNRYNPGQKLETSCGSLAYSAPEILLGDSYDAPAVDIWSLGVILYMLVCGHPPFQEANDSETLTMIMDCKYTVPPHVSDGCRRLIARMLQRDPAKRATLDEIANDAWLLEGAPALQPAHYLPLVSREHLSEDDHALILQKMVNGNIATKEEIVEALDKDEYNNITATYFLLAERKLRAQRQEQALMLSRGQPPPPPPPLPPADHQSSSPPVEEKQSAPRLLGFGNRATEAPAGTTLAAGHERQRKYSDVAEEDETGAGSGSESSRRSQRSSSNSLTSSQRTSNTSLASQRASNNSLAGSLRARGLLPSAGAPSAPRDLRLDLVEKTSKTGHVEKQKSVEQALEAPAPFPTNSNIGLGIRSPRSSPLTSPVTYHRTSTPASISPTSPSTSASSPASSPNVMSPSSKPGRSSLPSPSRVLHSVRSSPQLVLNEIFEEAESCSDSESNVNPTNPDTGIAIKSPGIRQRMAYGGNQRGRHRAAHVARASSAGPSARPSTSPPSLVRRYEHRRQLAKARTASCSSSDASDDDNESRKKRAEKLKSLPPRRDSHDDSSDQGGGDGGGNDGDGAGVSGGGGASTIEGGGRSGTTRPNGGSSGSNSGNSGSSSGVRHHLQPDDCHLLDQRSTSRPRYRILGNNNGRRYTNPCFSILSPGLGSETHLRASQSLSCLTEVSDEVVPDSPCIVIDTQEAGSGSNASSNSSLNAPGRQPAKSCGNLEKVDEIHSLDASSEFLPLVLPLAPPPRRSADQVKREYNANPACVQDVAMEIGQDVADPSDSRQEPGKQKHGKKFKSLFSRREGLNSSFKRSEKRWTSRKNRSRHQEEQHDPPEPHSLESAHCTEAAAAAAAVAALGAVTDAERGRTMNFLRSRLYKARSLGSLMKERILLEASHCQFELWKRFGRKTVPDAAAAPPSGAGNDVNMNGTKSGPAPVSPMRTGGRDCSTPVTIVHNATQHCSSC